MQQKGGSGKSTVAQSLAVCADQHNLNSAIIEIDPQGTLWNWSERREAVQPVVIQTLPQSLGKELQKLRDMDADWVFIDTPGVHGQGILEAARQSDLILIPSRVSMKDVDAMLPTIEGAELAKKPFYVLFNQVTPNSAVQFRERKAAIEANYGAAILPVYFSRRADFEHCDIGGLSAAELNPSGVAAAEIEAVYQCLVDILVHKKQPEARSPYQRRPEATQE